MKHAGKVAMMVLGGIVWGGGRLFAADVEVYLNDIDGTNALVVYDAQTNQIARIGSDGSMILGKGAAAGDFHVIGQTDLCSVVFAPDWATSGATSQVMLAEDDNGTHGMILRYDGGSNELYVIGKNDTTYRGPHLTVKRDLPTRVGIGMSNPTSTLHVAGDVTMSGKLLYEVPHTNYCFLAAPGFRPYSSSMDETCFYFWNKFYLSGGSSPYSALLTRDIQLPQNARIIGFDVYYIDNESSYSIDFTVELLRQDLTDPTAAYVYKSHSFTTSGSSSSIRSERADITSLLTRIDNENYATFIQVSFSPEVNGSSMSFHGVRLEYALEELP